MARLTPPTNSTFGIALTAIVAGIVTSPETGLVAGFERYSFWLLAGGAALLVLGVVFKRV